MQLGLYLSQDETQSWFWNANEQERVRRILVQKFTREPGFVPRIMRAWQKTWRTFNQATQYRHVTQVANYSLRELGSLYTRCVDAAIAQARYGYIVEPLHTTGEDDWLTAALRKAVRGRVSKAKENAIIATLTTPVFPSFTQEEEWSRAELARMWQSRRRGPAFKRALKQHCERFATIRGNYFSVPHLTEREVRSSLRSFKVGAALSNRPALVRVIAKKRTLIRRYHLTHFRSLIRAGELLTHMQDWRKWGVSKVNDVAFRVTREMSRQIKVPREVLLHATPSEILAASSGNKVNWKRIAERQEGALFWWTKSGVTIYTGRAVRTLEPEIFYGITSAQKELRGTPAMRGLVQGRVRIVRGINEIRAFRPGEILVANNTTPEFVPAMKKAAAIVAEQGGMTIHAAIIARELKIPCIVGTKIATQVLKDGDRVEVDAERGIVKKLP